MSVLNFMHAHWLGALTTAATAIAGWAVTHWVATPLLQFMSDRQLTLETVQRYGNVGHLASEAGVRAARQALASIAARMAYYAQGGPLVVRAYCRLRGYPLQWVGPTLNGVSNFVGENVAWQQRSNQCDAVRVVLGATRLMSRERRNEILAMIESAVQSRSVVA